MLIIPAIDLKDGRCVRLRQGRMDDDTVFSDDPVAVARRWLDLGARRLHLVDLDGAFAGEPRNAAVIEAICATAGSIPVQIGGGIRTDAQAEAYVAAGAAGLIIGTQAVRDPDFVTRLASRYPNRVLVGLDARDGDVAVEGWAEGSGVRAVDLARRFESAGVVAIVYTDIQRDGMMQGLNVEATAELANAVSIPVVASGGVSKLADLETLIAAPGRRIRGVIVGRALYEGTIDLAAAQSRIDGLTGGDADGGLA